MLQPVDRAEVVFLVDNVVDGLSSVPPFVEVETNSHRRRGLKQIAGSCLCCAAHGLSCLVTTWRGTERRTVLFDTGPDPWVFERNVTRLGVDLGAVEAMVLSHGHWDHAGAMVGALDMIVTRNGGKTVPTYMHPDMFHQRGVRAPSGTVYLYDDVPTIDNLNRHGAEVVSTTVAQSLFDGAFYVSGEIPRVTSFEVGMPSQVRRTADGTDWEPDELLLDERFLAVNVKDKGLVVLTACSHAGVVNVLHDARNSFAGTPIHAVMGGFHLSGINERIIPQTVEALAPFGLKTIAAAHCTGWRAVGALFQAYGKAVVPGSVGKTFTF